MEIKRFTEVVFQKYKCYMTFVMVLINVIVFLLMFLRKPFFDTMFVYQCGGMSHNYMDNGDWWRLFTSMFIHFDIQHLANNMLMLAVIGATTERYMGSVSFTMVYLLGGVAGNVFSAWSYAKAGVTVVSAGASGAVFAVIGGLLCVVVANRGKLENFTTKKVVVFIALILYQGIRSENVDNYAHGGGLIAGIVIGAACCLIRYMGNYGKIHESDNRQNEKGEYW